MRKCVWTMGVVLFLITSVQAQTDDKKQRGLNRFYLSVPFFGGFASYQLDPVKSTVSFPYSYNGSSTQYTYNSKLNAGGYKATSPFFGIGIEAGLSRSVAVNIQFSQLSTISPVDKSNQASISLLYNIRFNRNLTLQPAFGIGFADTNIKYPQAIDNQNKDLLILGTVYPYAYYQYSRYGSYYVYSNQTNVSLKDRKEGYLTRVTLRYRPAMLLTLGASLSYFFRADDKTLLNVANKSTSTDISLPNSQVAFQSSSSGNDLFQLNAFTFSVFVALYVSRD